MTTIKASVVALAALILTLSALAWAPRAMAASETVRAHCQSSDVSLRLGGCTLVIEDPSETPANRGLAHLNRGLAFKVKRAYDRAVDDYNQALRLRPEDPLAFNDRGIVLQLTGHVEYAIADFSQAIRLNPGYADIYYNRGAAYLDKGDAKAALADFDEAIKRGSNARSATAGPGGIAEISAGQISADYFFGRGRANFVLGKFGDAVPDYARAAALQPDKPYFALWLGMAQARSGARDTTVEFQKLAAKLKKSEWPFPVLELYLGSKTPEAVLAAAANPDQVCEAQYYIAQWRLARVEQQTDGLAALRSVASTCRKDFIERNAAVGELRRLGQ